MLQLGCAFRKMLSGLCGSDIMELASFQAAAAEFWRESQTGFYGAPPINMDARPPHGGRVNHALMPKHDQERNERCATRRQVAICVPHPVLSDGLAGHGRSSRLNAA